jgi:hypothetical protein
MLDLLKAVTKGLSKKWTVSNVRVWEQAKKIAQEQIKLNSGESATVVESDDDFEVFEVEDTVEEDTSSVADHSQVKKKLRPNDRTTVTYENGETKKDVKWKTVKADVESGKARVV